MSTKYGYIRTSRQRQAGAAGSDPQSQARQLQLAGVAPAHVYRDVGVSGTTGTNSRTAWHALDSRLTAGDSLVVASIDRIGRRWLDTVNAVIDLRDRGVKIVSLSADEAQWVAYLAADPDSPEAFLGHILLSFIAWSAQQEVLSIRRRTVAGLAKARAEGKTFGPPRKLTPDQLQLAARLRRENMSLRRIGDLFEVSRMTIDRNLKAAQEKDEE